MNRVDALGTEDLCVTSNEDDGNMVNDFGPVRGGGGGASGNNGGIDWSAFMSTLQGALDGLSMAMGQRNMSHVEQHHLLSDKSKIYTPQYKEIADRYDYSLNDPSNIVQLQGHKGRHTNAYHDFMLYSLNKLDSVAAGNPTVFSEGIIIIGTFVQDNFWLPYAKNKG